MTFLFLWIAMQVPGDTPYPWPHPAAVTPLSSRLPPPSGYHRVEASPESEGAWLRGLPLLPGDPVVLLHDGSPKKNQSAQAAVLDIDVGTRDLQQCADAVMRLRAEFLRAIGHGDDVCFHFTSGDPARWTDWRAGRRPRVSGSHVTWTTAAEPPASSSTSHASFRAYLDAVFTYAGSASLERDVETPGSDARLEAGDLLLQGGHPGHAVTVIDVAEDRRGRRIFLLAQSYMPAQQVHVLHAPGSEIDPWYAVDPRGPVATPEWRFPAGSWRRFREHPCPPPARTLAPTDHP